MSQFRTQIGPNIVQDDDLIFYYDMYNKFRSFKGKPTTNIFITSSINNLLNGWSVSGAFDVEDNFGVPEQTVVSSSTGTSTRYFFQNRNVTSGLAYTQSIYVKPAGLNYFQMAPSTGFPLSHVNFELTGEGSVSGPLASSASIDLVKEGRYQGWYRIALTSTCNSTTAGRIIFVMVDSLSAGRLPISDLTSGQGVKILDPQLEQNSFATPFVNGTRSTTQSLLDLTGINTITTANLVYDVNNFSFNGSSHYLTLASNFMSGKTSGSWEFWCYPDTVPPSGQYHQLYVQESSQWMALYNVSGGIFFGLDLQKSGVGWFDGNGGSATGATTLSAGDITAGSWYHVAYTWTGSTAKVYLNGVETASVSTGSVDTLSAGSTPREIGRRGGSTTAWDGKIATTRVYERALTSSEIKQNFNAQRARFGL